MHSGQLSSSDAWSCCAALCCAVPCCCLVSCCPRLQSHKLFNPPYGKLAPLSILAFCVFGGAAVITGAVAYQQKKGGFWFKKKQADK